MFVLLAELAVTATSASLRQLFRQQPRQQGCLCRGRVPETSRAEGNIQELVTISPSEDPGGFSHPLTSELMTE